MPKNDILNKIKARWWVIIIIFGIGGWVSVTEMTLADNSKRIQKVEKAFETVAESQQTIARTQEAIRATNGILLELYMKINGDTTRRWREIPHDMPVDSVGRPIWGAEWIGLAEDWSRAVLYVWEDSLHLNANVLWDKDLE